MLATAWLLELTIIPGYNYQYRTKELNPKHSIAINVVLPLIQNIPKIGYCRAGQPIFFQGQAIC
jgi:hypothetical protein